jgi:hypothetical protein
VPVKRSRWLQLLVFFIDRLQDLLQHLIGLLQYLIIGKTDHPKTKRSENVLPFLVGFDLLLMNRSIKLNNKSSFGTIKVNDKPVDRVLAVKFEPRKLAAAQPLPEQVFGWGRFLAQLACDCPQLSSELSVLVRIVFDH